MRFSLTWYNYIWSGPPGYFHWVTAELEWILPRPPISKNKLQAWRLTVLTLKFPKARLVSATFPKKKKRQK